MKSVTVACVRRTMRRRFVVLVSNWHHHHACRVGLLV